MSDNLTGTIWLGKVVNINDPDKEGKIKVSVFGKFDKLKTDDIPWATPVNNLTGGSDSGTGFFSVPKMNSIVAVRFNNGNLYEPEWFNIMHISDELKDEISESYENAHSLIYDTITEGGLKIYFTESKGLVLDYKSTILNIKNDNSITVTNPNGDLVEINNDGTCNIKIKDKIKVETKTAEIHASSKVWIDSPKIELGKTAAEAVIKGNTFQTLFNSHVHIGNMGAITTPPTIPLNGSELSQITKTQ